MKLSHFSCVVSILILSLFSNQLTSGAPIADFKCKPLELDSVLKLECLKTIDSSNDTLCTLRLRLEDNFNGSLKLNTLAINSLNLKIRAVSNEHSIILSPALEQDMRTCFLVSESPLKTSEGYEIHIPSGILIVKPDVKEVGDIDIDTESLASLSVGGAWHKPGNKWHHQGLFSIIDDDSLDGQIESSKHGEYTYGYYSLLFPLLESLGLKGNLAVEGRRIGIVNDPPYINDNGKTLIRLQDEKGWDMLCHSMECLGETMNNWLVDSIDSPLANKIFAEGPNLKVNANTVSVYDLQTHKQYWPNPDNTEWEETPARFIKPYAADMTLNKDVMYNPQYDIEWHWGEWKRRAESFGLYPVGFVTHNSTSSHALVPEIRKVFPFGLSDLGALNINYPPMLSSGVRAGLEGQSLGNYDGNSKDNTFNETHFKKFCAQIDETLKCGGWIIFNLHTYRHCWLNLIPGKLVSEGGTYPDEWVIPMKGMDSANDPLSPPAHLGISDWSEWHPCPGTRLEMMWKVLKYAKDKGLKNVTCSEGFEIMGNKISVGYFNNGHRFGKDYFGMWDTDDIYPHYIVSASDETFYYNPLESKEYSFNLRELANSEAALTLAHGQFLLGQHCLYWSTPDPNGVSITVMDFNGKVISSSPDNRFLLGNLPKGSYIFCAMLEGRIIGSIKLAI